ncbi:MAG: MmgE/PrpD family protein [Brevundimonas sp.]|uniref:MmgE/PrpD family protein n=1 Tax=Brevundimonas sp. TaxID=1871086 RepID=UPI0025B7FB01|nr:MmgE/PrpD family protein [Brevundimonas sp.]MBX3478469.1 MmgE/PrpD family protein [Brevundimonas sp.]
MSEQEGSLSLRLANRLARAPRAQDRHRGRRHLLDWLACAVAGSREPGAAEPRRLARREGIGACRIIGGGRAGPQAAALANGPAGALLEMDDVDRRGLLHPGPVVFPAVLAAAEATGVDDGDAILDAAIRGYEAMIRVGRAVGPDHAARFHVTASCGGFGAAAGAASILGLNRLKTAWALGNAGQQAFGLWQVRHEPVFTKALHDGRAAANGLASALLAGDGYAGPLEIFEGPHGFFAGLCPDGRPEAILDGGEAWAIHEVSFKPHAACRHAHAAIDAVLDLRRQAAGADLESLTLGVYGDALTFCDRPAPTTPVEAKFSLQHAAAVAWRHGDAALERFTPEAVADPDNASLRALVRPVRDADCDAGYPARFGATAQAVLSDGRTLRAEAPDALGDPERPLDDAALVAKARALFAWGRLTDVQADGLIAAALSLGEGAGLSDLWAAAPIAGLESGS